MQDAFGTLGARAPETNLPGTARRATELESVPPRRGLDALEQLDLTPLDRLTGGLPEYVITAS